MDIHILKIIHRHSKIRWATDHTDANVHFNGLEAKEEEAGGSMIGIHFIMSIYVFSKVGILYVEDKLVTSFGARVNRPALKMITSIQIIVEKKFRITLV